jgi:predicted DNA-binding transcriptional regulator YafY
MFDRYRRVMRSSRLLALLLALQRTGSSTAAALAVELEVSVRTIYRDVTALQAAGVPIYTSPGAGGGIRLIEHWRSPVDGMTAHEVRALVVGGGPAADLGLGSVLAVARSKLRSGLPAHVRTELDLIAERFLLDAGAWFRPASPPAALDVLAEAVWGGRRIDIRYERAGRVTARRLDPLGLVLKHDTWYLVARHRGSIRTYRATRITAASLRSERFDRPDGFDLDRYWSEAAASFDEDLRRVDTEILIPPQAVGSLRQAVPGELTRAAIEAASTEADGRLRVHLRVESIDIAFHQLAGIVGVEAVGPHRLRERLRHHGEQLATANR